jgi:hypothetical protein
LDLFKYAGKLVDRRFLKFINTVWYEGTIPESWQKAIVIPTQKRRYKISGKLQRY